MTKTHSIYERRALSTVYFPKITVYDSHRSRLFTLTWINDGLFRQVPLEEILFLIVGNILKRL